MKKTLFSGSMKPNATVSLEQFKSLIAQFGEVQIDKYEEVEFGANPLVYDEVWVFASSDESEPYIQVSGPGETEGVEVPDEVYVKWSRNAVCTQFHVAYPRSDRYGVPSYASSEEDAQMQTSYHFIISSDGFEVTSDDSGDDTPEQYFFKLLVPKAPEMKIKPTYDQVERSTLDDLFTDAYTGLREYYPFDLTPEDKERIRTIACKNFDLTGNSQADYERLRDAIERAIKPQPKMSF